MAVGNLLLALLAGPTPRQCAACANSGTAARHEDRPFRLSSTAFTFCRHHPLRVDTQNN